jgi:hypothetical protein
VADLPPERDFPQAEAVWRGDRDLVMQAGDMPCGNRRIGCGFAADGLALQGANRHILRVLMRVRFSEQLLR